MHPKPDDDTDCCDHETVRHEQPQYIAALSTQRNPHADFARALQDTEEDHAIETNRRENHRRSGEAGQDQHRKARARNVGRNDIVEGTSI